MSPVGVASNTSDAVATRRVAMVSLRCAARAPSGCALWLGIESNVRLHEGLICRVGSWMTFVAPDWSPLDSTRGSPIDRRKRARILLSRRDSVIGGNCRGRHNPSTTDRFRTPRVLAVVCNKVGVR